MCTLIILRRPDADWPVLIAANRDEMLDRAWLPPARHWPDRGDVVAGLDRLAGGSWLGANDAGVVAGVLNRTDSLGSDPDKRSRGELVLEALDHADAALAADALSDLNGDAYRPFNMVVADNRDAYWLRSRGNGAPVERFEIAPGLSMLTAHELNDPASPRIRRHLSAFRAASPPDPGHDDWRAWQTLMADRSFDPADGPTGAMNITTQTGFGTSSSSLIALPAPGADDRPWHWLFGAGAPDRAPYQPIL